MKLIFLLFQTRRLTRILGFVLRYPMSQKNMVCACIETVLFFLAFAAQAQGPASQWDKAIPGMVDGQSEIVVQTTHGDLVIGKKMGNGTFQLLRVSNGGSTLLSKTYSGTDYAATSTILYTADQGYLLGSVIQNAAGKYYQMIKLTSNGQFLWNKKYGLPPSSGTTYLPIIQTTDGGFMIGAMTGVGIGGDKTEELKDLCPGYYNNSANCGYNSDYWILKVDGNGNKQWDRSFGGGTEDNLRAMIPTLDGGCLLAGNSFSPKSVNSTNKTSDNLGMDDIWLVKVGSNGSKLWEKSLGGNNQDFPKIIVQTSEGGFLVRGDSHSGTNPQKTVGTNGVFHNWLVKVNKDGNYQWDKLPNWKITPNVAEIIRATKDEGFVVGLSSDAGIGGIKSEASQGGEDYWMIKYNNNGNRQWDKRFGGTAKDKLLTLIQFPDASFQLFGYSLSSINGDKTVFSAGGWLVKTYPAAPTNLTATPASATQINLQWRDNLVNESYYQVQRSTIISGSSSTTFTTIATLSGNATFYSDKDLPTNTTYAYRIKAVRNGYGQVGQPIPPSGSSDYSSTVTAKLINASVRITDFSPKFGQIGTEVIIKGYGFIEDGTYYVSNVKFNNNPAAPYGVESPTQIRAKVAPGTTSGLISLITPGGVIIFSESTFTVMQPLSARIQTTEHQVEEWTDAELVRFYPNPTENILNIELPGSEGEAAQVSVYELSGKLWRTFHRVAAEQVNQLDVSGLPSGVYLLRVQSRNNNRSFKLIKK